MLGAPPVSRGAATRGPACGSHRCSRYARGNSSDRSGTGSDNRRISRGEATTCRPSVSDRDDDKLARGANREHSVLTAGVHRLRASGCIPGALDLFGVLTATDLAARSSIPRHSCRLLDATAPARHSPIPKRHGQGGAIRIVIAILGGVWRPTQVGSDQPDWIRRRGSSPGRRLCSRRQPSECCEIRLPSTVAAHRRSRPVGGALPTSPWSVGTASQYLAVTSSSSVGNGSLMERSPAAARRSNRAR
jgi:hypothetical protein